MIVSEIELSSLLKTKLGEQEAKALVEFVEAKAEEKINSKKDMFLTKDDKVDIMRSIYLVGVIQFIAIVASVVGIINFMIK